MIEISCQIIQFFPDERIRTFQVTNKGQSGLLFKIKTNYTKVLDARPNTGLIAPGAQTKITVKRTQEVINNLKLQISSIECSEQLTNQNFKELWTKYEKNQVSNTLAVKIVDREQGHKGQPNDHSQTEPDNHVFQSLRISQQQKNKHQGESKSELDTKPRLAQQPNALQLRDANFEKGKKPIFQNESIVKSKMSQKIQENENLKKKLAQRQKQIQALNKNLFSKAKSLSENSTQNGSNRLTVLIIAFIFFVLGYYFGGRGGTQRLELNAERIQTQQNLHTNKSLDL